MKKILVEVSKKWLKENEDLVIYNYLASLEFKEVSIEQMNSELKETYGIHLTETQTKAILDEYVKRSLMSKNLRTYSFKNKK